MTSFGTHCLGVCAAAILISVNVKADLAVKESNNAPSAHTALEETVSGCTTRRVDELVQDTRYPEAMVKEAFAYSIHDKNNCANALKAFKECMDRGDAKALEIYNAINKVYNREMLKHLGALFSIRDNFCDNSTMPVAPKFLARKVMSMENQLNTFLALFAHELNKGPPDSIIDEAVGHTFDRVYALQEGALSAKSLLSKDKTIDNEAWVKNVALDSKQTLLQHKIEVLKNNINSKRHFDQDFYLFSAILKEAKVPVYRDLQEYITLLLNDEKICRNDKEIILYAVTPYLKVTPLSFKDLEDLANDLTALRGFKSDLTDNSGRVTTLLRQCNKILSPWDFFEEDALKDRALESYNNLSLVNYEQRRFTKEILYNLLNIPAAKKNILTFLLGEVQALCLKVKRYQRNFISDFKLLLERVKVVSSKTLFPMIEGMKKAYEETDFEQGSYDEDNPDPAKLIEDIDFSQYEINEAMIQDPRIEAANKESDAKLDEVTDAEYETAKSDLLERFRQLRDGGKFLDDYKRDAHEDLLEDCLEMKGLVNTGLAESEKMKQTINRFKAKVVFLRNHLRDNIKDESLQATILCSLSTYEISCSTRAQGEINAIYNKITGCVDASKETIEESVAKFLAQKRQQFIEEIALEVVAAAQIPTSRAHFNYWYEERIYEPNTDEYRRKLQEELRRLRPGGIVHYKNCWLNRAARVVGLAGNHDAEEEDQWFEYRRDSRVDEFDEVAITTLLKEKYTVEHLVTALRNKMNNHDGSEKNAAKYFSTRLGDVVTAYESRADVGDEYVKNAGLLFPDIDGELNEKFTKRSALSILMGLGYVKKKGA